MTEQELKTRMEALLAKQQNCLRVQKLLLGNGLMWLAIPAIFSMF